MKSVEVEILSDAPNNPVIRMPGRRFPSIAIQGDSLKILLDLAEELHEAAQNCGDENILDLVAELTNLLNERIDHYESVLKSYGIDLPYSKVSDGSSE